MAIEKLKINYKLKNKTCTNLKIKNHKIDMNADRSDHRHHTEIQNNVFHFISIHRFWILMCSK